MNIKVEMKEYIPNEPLHLMISMMITNVAQVTI